MRCTRKWRALVALPMLLLTLAPTAQETEQPKDNSVVDSALTRSVRRIADRLAQVRGEGFDRPPVAIRSPDVMAETVAQARTYRIIPSQRLESRGRAWSDVGLGGTGSAQQLWIELAADLQGIDLDAEGQRLLVSPGRLRGEDFGGTTSDRLIVADGSGGVHEVDVEEGDAAGEVEAMDPQARESFLATGVRPDEPILSHYLIHLRQLERQRRDSIAETTDELLAASAWAEGEANLVAVYFLFEGVGLVRTVLSGPLGPSDLSNGELVPPAVRETDSIHGRLLDFVYEDGYRIAVERFSRGGWNVFLKDAPRTVRQLRDPNAPMPTFSWPEPISPRKEWLLADSDRLGQQAISTLLASWIGIDSLATDAAAGWVDGRLLRWEPAGADGTSDGQTVWQTVWSSAAQAEQFASAYTRAVQKRYPQVTIGAEEPDWRVFKSKFRWIRLQQRGNGVEIVVSSPDPNG